MDIQFSGKMTKADYLDQVRLDSRPILKNAGFHIDTWFLLASIGAFIVIMSLILRNKYPGTGFFLIVGIIIVGIGLKFRQAINNYWNKNDLLRSQFTGRITNSILEMQSEIAQVTINWSDISGYGKHKDMIVLYKSGLSIPLLKHFFSCDKDWEIFHSYVVENHNMTHRVASRTITPLTSRSRIVILILILVIVSILLQHLGLIGS